MVQQLSQLILVVTFVTSLLLLNHNGLAHAQVGLFDKNHVHDVKITLEESDWDLLRNEKWFENFDDVMKDPALFLCTEKQNIYTWYTGNFTIDGETFNNVGVRRKGFVGSVIGSEDWPSLKIGIQKYTNDGLFFNGTSKMTCTSNDICDNGVVRSSDMTKRFTFNNNNQDGPAITTCLNLHLFEVMGAIAPRCNFANVTVNGIHRGTYTNIEPMKKDFLMRAFGDDTGDLYEGTIADMSEGNTLRLEKKTNTNTLTNEHVDRMIEVLKIEDDGMFLEGVKEILDLPSFLLFAMVEAMLNLDDGYTNNRNNFYCYFDTLTKKWYFMPWSPDRGLMTDTKTLFGDKTNDTATIVFTQTPLIRRLYSISEIREQYHEDMIQLLEDKWNTTAFLNDMDTMLNLTYPGVTERMKILDEKSDDKKAKVDGDIYGLFNSDYDKRINDMKLFFNTKLEIYLDELREKEPRPFYNEELIAYDDICQILAIIKYFWFIVAAIVLLVGCCCTLVIWCCCKHCKKKKPDSEKTVEVLPITNNVKPAVVLNATTGWTSEPTDDTKNNAAI